MKSARTLTFLASAVATFLCGSALTQESRPKEVSIDSLQQLQAVVCLLPGRVRKIGSLLTYVERRRVEEMTAAECEKKGGEYTVYDRTSDEAALEYWMEEVTLAENDATARAKAQTYIGEIYEKRVVPDYAQAARWYEDAVRSGSKRAMLHLANLYEHGLGVTRDLKQALALWRNGMGIEEELVLAGELVAVKTEAQRRIDEMTATLERQNQTSERLQQVLASTVETVDSQKAELQAAQQELDRLSQELAAQSNAPRGNATQLAALQRDIDSRSNIIAEQQARIAVLGIQLVGQRAQLVASAATAQIRQTQLTQALETVTKQQEENASLTETLARSEARIAVLQRDFAVAQTDLSEREQRATQLAAEIERLKASGADGVDRTSPLQALLDASRRDLETRSAEVKRMQQTLESQRASFEQTLQATSNERAALQGELDRSRSERQRLETQLGQRDAEVTALRGQISAANGNLATTEAEAERLKNEIARAEASKADANLIATLQRQLAANEQQIAKQSDSISSLEVQWQMALGEVTSLKRELDKRATGGEAIQEQYEARLALLDQQILDVTKERDALNQAVSDQRREKAQDRMEIDLLGRELRDLEAMADRQSEASRDRIRSLNEEISLKERDLLARDTTIRELNAELQQQRFARDRLRTERTDIGTLVAGTRGPRTPVVVPADAELGKYRFRALIIGNQDYTFLNDLSTVEQDVNDVKTLLEQVYGFERVDVRMDLTREAMYAELGKLREIDENEFVLIYYAGHSTLDEFDNGYWQPVDFVPGKNPANTGISVAQITQYVNMMQAKHVMVIADSCYSGALLRDNTVEVDNADQRVKYWVASKSRTVLTSGGMAPVLDRGGDGQHSVFAKAFIDVLANNDRILSGEDLHARIRDQIRKESRELNLEQTPQFAGLADAGHQNGQFVFVPR